MSDDDYVYIWPDGTWCYADALEEMLTFMSDDYARVHVDNLLVSTLL